MSEIMVSKQSVPSVIARLMGLEELNPQQPVQKRQRVLSESYLRRVASIGVWEKHSFHARNSFRLGSEDQKECKDAFGVSMALKNEKLHLPPVLKRKVKSGSSEVNRTFMRQKPRNAKCVMADKKLHVSIEDFDASEVIDSEPLNDWQCVPSPSQSGHIPFPNSSSFSDFRGTDVHQRFWRTGRGGYVKSNEKIKNGLSTGSNGEHGISNVRKFHRSPFEFPNGRRIPAKRIVVLKPFPESPQNSVNQFSSSTATHGFQLGDRKHGGILNPESENLFIEAEGGKNIANNRKFRRLRSSLSEESNRQIEHGLSIMSARVTEVETGESGASGLNISSALFFSDWRNHYPPSYSGISYVAVEANEKIFGRGTTAKNFKRVWAPSRGKMLRMPDNKLRPILDGKPSQLGFSNQNCHEKEYVNLGFPFCISSSGASEDRIVRSTTPSDNSSGNGSSKSSFSLQNDRYVMPLESLNRVRRMSMKQELKEKRGMVLQHTGPRSLGSPPNSSCLPSGLTGNGRIHHLKYQLEEAGLFVPNSGVPRSSGSNNLCSYSEVDHALQANSVTEEELEVTLEDNDQSEQNCVVSRSSLHDVSISVVPDILLDSETEAIGQSFVNVEKHYGSTEHILEKVDSSSSYAPEKSIQQDMPSGASEEGSVSSCSSTEFESLMSLEDAYHPSPVSVLEPIFKNNISSCSENFQNGGADLQGLHLQLEILKSEVSDSDAYSEGSGMIVSSDEDTAEVVSIGYSEENEDSVKENREFSYMVDVFSEAGFQSRNPYVGSDKWHSPECLIDPSVLEKVEKKYAEQKSWKRSERRLLFDRINSGLMEMLHSCTSVRSLTKPVGRRFSFRHSPETITEELWRLLVSQGKQVFNKLSEKVLGNDDGWLDLGDEVEVIGIEIENSLIDELAAEFITMENW
ncbi:hypothetical protein HS088_TW16G00241 [Tripterygium wilfordii]|uniref:DUF4378 domain-containing protein n=1 Tax=Tripterygium wilfordii TaxID=458696 RepID=A0A7J7CIF1_TRIWF|nr:hypothetical protein HS088_TW16G00241 [Tripterygium wilfordii]